MKEGRKKKRRNGEKVGGNKEREEKGIFGRMNVRTSSSLEMKKGKKEGSRKKSNKERRYE